MNPKGLRLEVVTYNMRANPEGLEPWLRRVDADIVFLQEVSENYTEGVPALLELYPYQVSQSEAWSNMILSRYPLMNEVVAAKNPIQRSVA